jgi:cytochrome b561
VPLTLFCLLVLMVVLPVAGFLTELERADTARTLAAVQATLRGESRPS